MALIKCHECGKDVSSEAAACPNCGAKPKKPEPTEQKKKFGFWQAVIFLCIMGVIISVFDKQPSDKLQTTATPASAPTPAATPEPAPAKELSKEEMDEQIALLQKEWEAAEKKKNAMHPIERYSIAAEVAKAIKSSANDPKSVEFEAAVSNPEGTVMCFVFRGKNTFGALVKQDAIFINSKIISGADNPKTWDKNCTGSGLVDVLRGAKQA